MLIYRVPILQKEISNKTKPLKRDDVFEATYENVEKHKP